MKNSQTGQNYRDRVEFCKDSKVEYDFTNNYSDLTFWDKPLDVDANTNRTAQMLKFYNDLIKDGMGDYGHMKPLPSAEDLAKLNPPCWKNSPMCAKAANGCRRKLTAQVCEVCSSPAADCKKPGPTDAAAPTLNKQFQPALPTNAAGVTTVPRSVSNNETLAPGAGGASEKTPSAASPVSLVAASTVAVAAFLLV
ncbi:hypothetical protein SDRG_16381 [Saprolegnia diclina VS20]|uniref:Uncharacterized protein n=1 Tax=Saprolegnia diclina (strain VS20) TaxID=1156394 RepID=T0PXM8_SAPDV|nr:hypothetical protein SDRG_16381 [Saprolegnia diclina VS20]EQC25785.1 hypothetical protein SDRG_16381 [Saprolegnia diclina VS20]|eukprot:XP_008620810.1 hypothetical protein SDRG_16381 [Saprolegnia diclina VS20]